MGWSCAFRGTQEHHPYGEKAPETHLRFACPLRSIITKSTQAFALPTNFIFLLQQDIYKDNVSKIPGFCTTNFFSVKAKLKNKVHVGHMCSGRTSMCYSELCCLHDVLAVSRNRSALSALPLALLSITYCKTK